MGWAFMLDAIIDAENKKASSTSSEFWQSFRAIEQGLHDIESENDPAYQKLKLQLDKYVRAIFRRQRLHALQAIQKSALKIYAA